MKLTVNNKNGIVDSAFFKVNEFCISLVINTAEKWRSYDTKSGLMSEKAREETFIFEKDPEGDGGGPCDSVTLISETDAEKEALGKLEFENHCKDQIHIIFLHESILGYNFSRK